MHIRLESPDQPEVIALIKALDDYQDSLYPPESRHALDLASLKQAHVLFAVARDESAQAIGCGAVVLGEEAGELKRMYVHPRGRGRGTGKALLERLEAEARRAACPVLRLETGPYQPEALGLYARQGYERCGPFGKYTNDPLSVFMQKPLGAPGARNLHDEISFADGGCTCRRVRYRLATKPMFVNCCHCSWCQRESGASFAVNAMIESDRVALLQGEVEWVDTPSNSGKGQLIARCPQCRVAVWSHYAGAGNAVTFVRVGTLDEPALLPPDVHIFTTTKQPWVVLPPGTPAMAEYYKASELWPAESLARRAALVAKAEPR